MCDNKRSRIKYQAFAASLCIHTTLVAAGLYMSHANEKHIVFEEKKIVMHLANFIPTQTETPLASQKSVQPTIQPKKAEQKTLRKIPHKQLKTVQQDAVQNEVASSEAFTPPMPDEVAQDVTLHEETSQYSPALQPSVQNQTALQEPSAGESLDHTTLSLIRSMIQEALIYPPLAKRLKLEGIVVVSFTLTRDGRVEDALILSRSASASLDTRALQTVTGLSGSYPELPKKTTLEIPIAFTLKKS